MLRQQSEAVLAEDIRRELFTALIDAQDLRASPHQARKQVALQFGVSLAQVAAVEREGVENDWPPL